ncbi:MAG: thiol:disulfide interchange protein DsbD [Gammaproteobacteria bacterium]|jgi:thiol:disulfide interchange protein DsbD
MNESKTDTQASGYNLRSKSVVKYRSLIRPFKLPMNLITTPLLAIFLLLTGPILSLPLQAADELLAPEKAFALEARFDGNQIVADYKIADGYYMYRERFSFAFENSQVLAGDIQFPQGKIINDEFFGDMEVYRDQIRVVIPVQFQAGQSDSFDLIATGQGCADIGVCYPPLKQRLTFIPDYPATVLPVPYRKTAPSIQSEGGGNIAALQSLLAEATKNLDKSSPVKDEPQTELKGAEGLAALLSLGDDIGLSNDDEIPHPDKAFALFANLDSNNIVQVRLDILANTYLYKDKFKVSLIKANGHQTGAISLPAGKLKVDEFIGKTEVFYDQVNFSVPLISDAGAASQINLSLQYQGCVEDRICYPPVTKYLNINLDNRQITISNTLEVVENSSEAVVIIDSVQQPQQTDTQSKGQDIEEDLSKQAEFAALLTDKDLLLIVGLFFLAGIGLTFTPCVFPMIPILSSIIAGQGDNITTRKAFSLSLVYVLAMASTYAVAGAIAGYYGAEYNIQIWFQDPVVLGVFAGIFVLLSLSMFGFYELQMPSVIQSKLTAISNNQEGGNIIGVALMGLFSAIIVGPCITAPLVGALIFITQSKDVVLGGLALFALGLGMGVPLLLIGTSAGKLLPRAGQWMDAVKSFFGVVLLAVAIWLLERVLPVSITQLLIALLLIISAIYMGALESLSDGGSGWEKLRRGLAIIILIQGGIYLFAANAGSKDLIQPLGGFPSASSQSSAESEHIVFRQIKGVDGLQLALNDARNQNRTTMLDFYADWCISCKEMEKYAFTHPEVVAQLKNTVLIQSDVTDNDQLDSDLMSSLGIYGPPAILFYDANGQEIRHKRVVGEMSGEDFAAHIRSTLN